MVPEIVVFSGVDFQGEQLRTNLSGNVSSQWNDKISSIIVVSGTWQFFEHKDYGGASSKPLTPGYYHWVEMPQVGMKNDTISSFKYLSTPPF